MASKTHLRPVLKALTRRTSSGATGNGGNGQATSSPNAAESTRERQGTEVPDTSRAARYPLVNTKTGRALCLYGHPRETRIWHDEKGRVRLRLYCKVCNALAMRRRRGK